LPRGARPAGACRGADRDALRPQGPHDHRAPRGGTQRINWAGSLRVFERTARCVHPAIQGGIRRMPSRPVLRRIATGSCRRAGAAVLVLDALRCRAPRGARVRPAELLPSRTYAVSLGRPHHVTHNPTSPCSRRCMRHRAASKLAQGWCRPRWSKQSAPTRPWTAGGRRGRGPRPNPRGVFGEEPACRVFDQSAMTGTKCWKWAGPASELVVRAPSRHAWRTRAFIAERPATSRPSARPCDALRSGPYERAAKKKKNRPVRYH